MKLGLIADTKHYIDASGRCYSLTPVVRQLELWADWFSELVVCAPVYTGAPPPGFSPYERFKVTPHPLPAGGGKTVAAKLGLISKVLQWWPHIHQVMSEVDAVHFRSPCNIALVGLVAARFSRTPRYAMYAGQWSDYENEPFFFRIQKRLLAKAAFGGPVAIYGKWPNQAAHLFSSFSPSFTLEDWLAESHVIEARLAALSEPLHQVVLVTAGHLDKNKRQSTVIQAVRILRDRGVMAHLECFGDGAERGSLTDLIGSLKLEGAVTLHGRRDLAEVKDGYRRAHFNILASKTEGYPKVLAEGMIHGAIGIASDVGINAQIVDHGSRGATFPLDRPDLLADRICEYLQQPERMISAIRAARAYTRTTTLEAFQELHRTVLSQYWDLPSSGDVSPELAVGDRSR